MRLRYLSLRKVDAEDPRDVVMVCVGPAVSIGRRNGG
jgi:hypothetical protein